MQQQIADAQPSPRGTVYTDSPAFQVVSASQGNVNPVCLSREIEIESAQDHPCVLGIDSMEVQEVFAIQRQENASVSPCVLDDVGIGPTLTAAAHVLHCYDVVAQPSEGFYNGKREVLVGKKACHRSVCFVLSDLLIDGVAMAFGERPCVCQILRSQSWIRLQQGRIACAQSSCLLQNPNRNSGADDSRRPAAHARSLLDAREAVT
jgi:hypothetical protein